ncbi:MAG: hypothetical protein SFT92_09400, partial [Rickettsiales bacterium]|nr:hypothetical protein [Rickettsiales bacterium]
MSGVGLNECLSAAVAEQALNECGVEDKYKLQVVSIIEATIPFKKPEFIKTRVARLADANRLLEDGNLSAEEQTETIKAAIAMANKDVSNFMGDSPDKDFSVEERVGILVRGSWRLAPEMTPILRGKEYTPTHFTQEMQNDYGFFNFVQPDILYHAHEGYPPDAKLQKMHQLARDTIKGAQDYMAAKLVSAAFVEAVESATRPDNQMQPFLSDFLKTFGKLPKKTPFNEGEREKAIRNLLENRGEASVFDIPQSPIAAYMADTIGVEQLSALGKSVAGKLKLPPELATASTGEKQAFRESKYKEILTDIAKALGKDATHNIAEAIGHGKSAEDRQRAANIKSLDSTLAGLFRA